MSCRLEQHVEEHVRLGCEHWPKALGFKSMPDGYALMLDADGMYFYWLRNDGAESTVHWNRWAVYHGAMEDAARHSVSMERGAFDHDRY